MVSYCSAIKLCFCIFGKNSKIQNGRHFWGQEIFFFKLPIVHYLDTLWVENFDEISHSLGDRHIYVFCYVAITQKVKAITIQNNTKQVIDRINLHTKFYKDELNMFLLKE